VCQGVSFAAGGIGPVPGRFGTASGFVPAALATRAGFACSRLAACWRPGAALGGSGFLET
jgi:hypothetical protein